MKKTYIIPAVTTTVISTASLLAASPGEFKEQLGTTGVNGDAALVKGDRGSRQDYNVWNDDWSQ